MLQSLTDWLSDSSNSNAIRAIVALLAIPGALWGFWLFLRWTQGKGIDAQIDQIGKQLSTLRIEQPDGSFVSFKEEDVNATICVIKRKRYVLSGVYDVSLEYVVLNALGPFIGRIDVRGSSDFVSAAKRFAHVLGSNFQGGLAEVEASAYDSGSGPILPLRGLMEQIWADLTALNLIFEHEDYASVCNVIGMTNMGKAVVGTLMKRSAAAPESLILNWPVQPQ